MIGLVATDRFAAQTTKGRDRQASIEEKRRPVVCPCRRRRVPLMAIYPAQMETTTSQDSNNNMASHRKYRMVALDLDGTLLNSKHELSDVTVDYLRSLNERGFVVAIATGR
eukprot:scaffold1060_cov216-Alexandrium_tamarense.AAC.9